MRFLIVLLFVLPGCYSSFDIPPERLTEGCGIVDDREPLVHYVDASNMLNSLLFENREQSGFCFVSYFEGPIPATMLDACAEYLSRAESCEDVRERMRVCYSCWEVWDSSL